MALATIADLSPGRSLPAPLCLEATHIETTTGRSRRAEVELTDASGEKILLVDYEGAELSVEWRLHHWYRIRQCSVSKGSKGYALQLEASKRTEIEDCGPIGRLPTVLVIGDTHVGRRRHPRTKEEIRPVRAFSQAVAYGLEHSVDAVIHAGDIFHQSASTTDAELVDEAVFTPLREADVPFYYVTGNHEAAAGTELLETGGEGLIVNLDPEGTPLSPEVCLYGIDHHENGRIPWNRLQFPDSMNERYSVLVLHQSLRQLSGPVSGSIDLEELTSQAGRSFDLVISGHHHDAVRDTWNGTPVMYTGAGEHMSTNESSTDRVAWLIRFNRESITIDPYEIP